MNKSTSNTIFVVGFLLVVVVSVSLFWKKTEAFQTSSSRMAPMDTRFRGMQVPPTDTRFGGMQVPPTDTRFGGMQVPPTDTRFGGMQVPPTDTRFGGMQVPRPPTSAINAAPIPPSIANTTTPINNKTSEIRDGVSKIREINMNITQSVNTVSDILPSIAFQLKQKNAEADKLNKLGAKNQVPALPEHVQTFIKKFL